MPELAQVSCIKWTMNCSPEFQHTGGELFKSRMLSGLIDGLEDGQELSTNGGESGEWDSGEIIGQILSGAVTGSRKKEGFQIPIRFMVDSDTGMPFR